MATIQQSIALTDGVSPQFQKMAQAAAIAIERFEKVAAVVNKIENTGSATMANGMQGIGSAAIGAIGGVEAVSAAVNRMDSLSPHNISTEMQRINGSSNLAAESLRETSAAANRVGISGGNVQRVVTPLRAVDAAAHVATANLENTASAAARIGNANFSAPVIQLREVGSAAYSAAGGLDSAANAANNFNSRVDGISSGGIRGVRDSMAGMIGMFALGNIAANAIGTLVEKISEVPGHIPKLSDEYSGIVSRIKLVTDSEEQAVALNDQIYYSALRARGGYAEMADAVSKIAMTAKEAFPNPNEVVPFMENIQKLFTVGGTDIVRQKDALLQLTQALGSGKLQGDEFRSIAEAAPLIEQIVAHYMGVTQGQLKELSTKGEITAEIMKNAVLGATAEINQKFAAMPQTWGQAWQTMKTVAFHEFVPVLNMVSALANSQIVKGFGEAFGIGIHFVAIAIIGIINNLQWLGGIAVTVGEYIGGWLAAGFIMAGQGMNFLMAGAGTVFPYLLGTVIGLAAAWAILNSEMLINAGISAAALAWNMLVTAWMLVQSAAVWAIATAKAAWTAITMGVVGAQMFLAFAIAVVTGNLYIIAAVIIGVIVAALAIWGLASVNLRDVFADAMDFMIDACQNGVNSMVGMINGLIDVINKAAGGLNSLFGTSIGTIDHVATVNFQEAKKYSGYVRDGTVWDHLKAGASELFSVPNMAPPAAPDMSGYPATMDGLGDIGKNTKDTADHARKIKDALDITDEDIKYLRDIAEQEAINKYTTAEVKIDMGGIQNNVSSDMDLDGMMRYVNDSIFESMVAAAGKVHP